MSSRIYQDAQVTQTKQFTSVNPKAPLLKENLGELTRNLLDLRPDKVVFYVGGYPDDFRVNMHIFFLSYMIVLGEVTFLMVRSSHVGYIVFTS